MARPEQILYVVRHMGDEALADMELLTWFTDRAAFALDRCAAPGPKWCFTVDSWAIAVGGFTIGRPGVASAWVVATPELETHARDVLMVVKRLVKRVMVNPDVRRLEAYCRESWPGAVRFAEHVGLQREGRHPGTCSDGGAVISLGITKGEAHA